MKASSTVRMGSPSTGGRSLCPDFEVVDEPDGCAPLPGSPVDEHRNGFFGMLSGRIRSKAMNDTQLNELAKCPSFRPCRRHLAGDIHAGRVTPRRRHSAAEDACCRSDSCLSGLLGFAREHKQRAVQDDFDMSDDLLILAGSHRSSPVEADTSELDMLRVQIEPHRGITHLSDLHNSPHPNRF